MAALLDRRPGRARRASAAPSSVVAANALDEPARRHHAAGRHGRRRPARCRCSSTAPSGTRRCTCCSPRTWSPASSWPACTRSGMLRGRRDRYHRLGLAHPVHRRRGRDAAADRRRATSPRARSSTNEPAKFAAIEALPQTGTHVPETLGGRAWSTARSATASTIPSGASLLSGFSPSTRDPRARRDPAAVPPARPAGHDRAPGVRRHGRHRVRAARPRRVVRAAPGGGGGTVPREPRGSCGPRRQRGARARRAVVRAGWSPRSGASRGPSSVCCSPATPSRRRATCGCSSAATARCSTSRSGVGTFYGPAAAAPALAGGRATTVEGGDADVPYGPSGARRRRPPAERRR